MNLEAGLPGDVDPGSFIDPRLLGGEREATQAQEWLAANAATLRGHKVMLAKVWDEDSEEAYYNIHVQDGRRPRSTGSHGHWTGSASSIRSSSTTIA